MCQYKNFTASIILIILIACIFNPVNVQAASTATTIKFSTLPTSYTQGVSFQATARLLSSGKLPQERIYFYLDGAQVGSHLDSTSGYSTHTYSSIPTAGTHTLSATFLGDTNFAPSTVSVTIYVASTAPPTTYLVKIQVTNSTGIVLPDCIVTLSGTSETTDINGFASFTQAAGTFPLRITKSGYLTISESIIISGNTTITRAMTIEPPQIIHTILSQNTSIVNTSIDLGIVYLNAGVTLSLINSTVTISDLKGGGKNGFIVNSTKLGISSLSIGGDGVGHVSLINSKIFGQTNSFTIDNNILKISNVSFTDQRAEVPFLILRHIQNSIISKISYRITSHYASTSTVAISVENCNQLTLDHINGIGMTDVNTPHFHISIAGATNTNILVKNSYFYGGGNGGTSGNINYVNCTYDSIVDGTEIQKTGTTTFTNCTWMNTHDSEINIQGGVNYLFIGCTFSKGLINLDNGLATLINCKSVNGFTFMDLGDNVNGGYKYLGVTYIDNVKVDWNTSNNPVSLRVTPMPKA